MASYDKFSRFYDAIMGDRAKTTDRLLKFIRRAHPKARTVLELGCGTGSVLKHLAMHYQVWGLDASSKMLSIAKKKVPSARLFRADMVNFALAEKFDVICCVFDSINHVLSFAAWKQLFANVRGHLSPQGVFIFDINTLQKLARHIAEPAWVHYFGDNLLIMKIGKASQNASNWNIKVFERIRGNRYALHEEDIQEASFPEDKITRALKAYFREVKVIDTERRRPSKKSERLYFICSS